MAKMYLYTDNRYMCENVFTVLYVYIYIYIYTEINISKVSFRYILYTFKLYFILDFIIIIMILKNLLNKLFIDHF